jgi:hypothetical protein
MLTRILVLTTLALAGCGNGTAEPQASNQRPAPTPMTAPAGEPPSRITVAAQSLSYGFALDTTRTPAPIDAFSITRYPIAVGDYRKCVASGVCSAPASTATQCTHRNGADGRTYDDASTSANLAVTCVTPDQAKSYCSWLDARLPTAGEWLLAARGPSVHRFAWGDQAPTCKMRNRISFFADYPNACCGQSCDSAEMARLGAHDDTMSPTGLTDVLLTRGELIGPNRDAGPGCPVNSPACLVVGIAPGAIDGLTPAPTPTKDGGVDAPGLPLFAFRCVWPGASK